jgi:hypothetical protein
MAHHVNLTDSERAELIYLVVHEKDDIEATIRDGHLTEQERGGLEFRARVLNNVNIKLQPALPARAHGA